MSDYASITLGKYEVCETYRGSFIATNNAYSSGSCQEMNFEELIEKLIADKDEKSLNFILFNLRTLMDSKND